ncbi:cryptochrome/photolyase family protein [Mangrovibacillus cuniculi]|uniref:Deoxyribodipyrimidine photo-lyase n=1 Tax=Mangrovibacillus cuniculi TaxID=2593652 RepID=A0A7S8HEY1_9BACI|nr:deoxyribodipyrimidine photo-lyase [Mangrovibacillus cuniculi]QPC45951.1 deoxyribodipyrimidine photo-lyase [Mangrovibacillus cuniculi]
MQTSLLLLRDTFRLHDHPGLYHAVQSGEVIPLVVIDNDSNFSFPISGAKAWWLHHAILSFQQSLEKIGGKLWYRMGDTLEVVKSFVETKKIHQVVFHYQLHPEGWEKDLALADWLKSNNITYKIFDGTTIFSPWEVSKQDGTPYRVYSPYFRACMAQPLPKPLKAVKDITVPSAFPLPQGDISDLGLHPSIAWYKEMDKKWTISEAYAVKLVKKFTEYDLGRYNQLRDFPAVDKTSTISPYLATGMLSAKSVASYITKKGDGREEPFMRQLIWRDFAYHLLYHFPKTIKQPLNPNFENFAWETDNQVLEKWKKGMTGYPIVDAGMRQLWRTGHMHNRVRMIVASFLTKHLLQPWQIGAEWFMDTLVDADIANNTMGWQWVAGSGADASPYFRIFNPTVQSKKFDKSGEYIKKWVPELAGIPEKYIHEPWTAPDHILKDAGVKLGVDYPSPMVDHKAARERALAKYQEIK